LSAVLNYVFLIEYLLFKLLLLNTLLFGLSIMHV